MFVLSLTMFVCVCVRACAEESRYLINSGERRAGRGKGVVNKEEERFLRSQ